MPDTSPRLALPYILPAQAQKHVTHNEALQTLDALVQLRIDGFGTTAPPPAPQPGATYALGAGATAAWAGQDGRLAVWAEEGAWRFLDPQAGWLATDPATARVHVHDGGAWVELSENLDMLGINAAADPVNRLALAAEAALFSHAGAGHRLKINKAAGTDTASLLYQSGFTGHAEMGLAGDNDFSIKTSADGSTWTTALRLDAATGHASGAMVQAAATDTTPGRLARADHAYGPGNLLGTVSETAGVPTGAVLETGSNADGHWLRLACGTQIVWAELAAGAITAFGAGTYANPYRTGVVVWNFPAAFAAAPVVTGCAVEPSTSGLRGAVAVNLQLAPTAGTARMQAVRLCSDNNADAVTIHARATGRWY